MSQLIICQVPERQAQPRTDVEESEGGQYPPDRYATTLTHFLRFSLVGAVGIGAQLTTLEVLNRLGGVNYLIAVGLAVELAIAHNFFWHCRWTWSDRQQVRMKRGAHMLVMLLRFNFTAGAVSLTGNLVFMRLLVGQFHLGLLRANIVSITLCWLLNFLLSDRVVFI
jgi:dolichol-phosphate mannosyltransferase